MRDAPIPATAAARGGADRADVRSGADAVVSDPVRRALLAGVGATAVALALSACTAPDAYTATTPPRSVPPTIDEDWRPRVVDRPVGAGDTRFESLPDGDVLATRVDLAPSGSVVTFLPGTYAFHDFTSTGDSTFNGAAFSGTIGGIAGSGAGRTIFEMVPYSSTRAALVPRRFPATNQLSLMRVSDATRALSGFTLQATPQRHLYNGLRISQVDGLRMHDVRIVSVPGDNSSPPGETFGINDYRTRGSLYTRVEVDGGDVGGAGFGANVSQDITMRSCNFHDNRYSAGATFYVVKNILISDSIASRNGVAGFNFERVTGTVRMTRPVTLGNRRADVRIASDTGSARYTIVDPVFNGSRFTVLFPSTYAGRPNVQRASDIRLVVNGRDRTADLLQFTST